VRSLIGSFTNKSPVPLAPRRAGDRSGMNFYRRAGSSPNETTLATYEEIGTVYAIVNRLATSTSKADWTMYKKAASGIKEDRTPVTSHAMIDLWNRPNPFMHRRRFVEMCQQHIDLTGESDILPAYAGGFRLPLELWPVRPDRIEPVPDPFEFLKGYVYTSPDGEMIPLDRNECLPILMPNPRDPYRGLGPIQSVLVDIDSSTAASEWNRAFFENSAEPGGVIEVPTSLNDDEFNRLRDQWNADHRGVGKAHRVAILESEAKWVSNSIGQKDMQFVELRGLSREIIMEAFGFPKSVLGIVEDVNRANAEASEYLFAKWLVEDRLDRWRDWLNFSLMPLYGPDENKLYEWDYESPVPENSEADNAAITAKSTALTSLVSGGFDAAEVLEFFGWPALSYTKPEPPTIVAPGGKIPGKGEKAPAKEKDS
jgi:HK97 family phage portal protein